MLEEHKPMEIEAMPNKTLLLFLGVVVCISVAVYAAENFTGPVGINNANPQRTLEVSATSGNPAIRISKGASTTSFLQFIDGDATASTIEKVSASGVSVLDISPRPVDGVSAARFRFFRTTNTTGQRFMEFYKGDNTATKVSQIGVGGTPTFFTDTRVGIGTQSPSAAYLLDVAGDTRVTGSITAGNQISSAVVEIRGEGNDLAEGFKVHGAVAPGMVVSISAENIGEMEITSRPYDRAVAGIVSGAGDKRVGIQLGHAEEVARGELTPVALTGRVWCYVDASFEAVTPGDLLTTSATPGHAMKVLDYQQAQGAIIGKAMTPLVQGQGLVLVLVSLQ